MSVQPEDRKLAKSGDATRFLREPEVLKLIGISKMTLRRWEQAGRFPARYKIGPNTVAWKDVEVGAWISNPAPGFAEDCKTGSA